MINARSEKAATKPAFRDALTSRRCLIPADGFYEWQRTGKAKQPYCFEVNAGELFAFAGLWNRWKDPSGQWVKSCSILTTTPNAVTSAVHDRMPVILDPDSYDLWLDPGIRDVGAASDLLKPHDARMMRCYPVSTRINASITWWTTTKNAPHPWNSPRFRIGSSRSGTVRLSDVRGGHDSKGGFGGTLTAKGGSGRLSRFKAAGSLLGQSLDHCAEPLRSGCAPWVMQGKFILHASTNQSVRY
jgi:hypothetical protein